MGLAEYHRKRNFAITSEPRGAEAKDGGRSFVVQKHAASRLHYDFRLELEGVLKSWSVPKGPSVDPTVKRLAMATEDHPVDYGAFEGIIPAGEYGGGTVLLWDRGTWAPLGDPHKDYRAGNLKFELHGEKLRGRWALVRIKGKDQRRDGDRTWLLVKERDDQARPEDQLDITALRPESIASGRSLEQIAAEQDRVWHSNRPPAETNPRTAARARWAAAARAPAPPPLPPLPGATPGPLPPSVELQVPDEAPEPPEGDDWLHELAIDGLRLLARAERGSGTRLIAADGDDWTARFPTVVRAVEALPVSTAAIDGHVAIVLPDGTTSREALEQHLASSAASGNPVYFASGNPLVFFASDLLHLEGQDLRRVPLERRKEALAAVLGAGRPGVLRYADHIVGHGAAFFAQACAAGGGAVISKRRDRPHQPGAGSDWVKAACAAAASTTRKAKGTMTERKRKAGKPAATVKPSKSAAPARPPRGAKEAEVAGVRLTNPDRVLYGDVGGGFTKRDLATFYAAIGDKIVPQVAGRPLALVRCPEGMSGQCFYMKHAAPSVATTLRRVKIREQTKTGDYLVADAIEGLVGLVQMSVLEVHTWNSTVDHLERPDRVVFDLDPGPEVGWPQVVEAAHTVRQRLAGLGFTSFVKTTGGKGLHVVLPLEPTDDWETCFTFSRVVAEAIAAGDPRHYTTAMPKEGREAKILLDFYRNRRGSTSVAAYSTRARAGAPVSVPVTWDELDDLSPAQPFTVLTVPRRLERLRIDPWKDYQKSRKRLSEVVAKMEPDRPKRTRSRRAG